MKIIEFTKLYKKVKEYSNGKHWIDLYNLWKLRHLDAELKEALYIWVNDGVPSVVIHDVSFVELISSESMNPIQAFLYLDWLKREPVRAIKFMADQRYEGGRKKLKQSDMERLDEIIKSKGGNPKMNPHLEGVDINDHTDIII